MTLTLQEFSPASCIPADPSLNASRPMDRVSLL